MKYENLTESEKAIVDKYFDRKALAKDLAEAQSLIGKKLSSSEIADHYGTIVNDLGNGRYYIDANTEKFTFTIIGDENGAYVARLVDVWGDDDGFVACEYDMNDGTFHRIGDR